MENHIVIWSKAFPWHAREGGGGRGREGGEGGDTRPEHIKEGKLLTQSYIPGVVF